MIEARSIMAPATLSIVIPLHNEAGHVRPNLESFLDRLPEAARARLSEIILVENGSTDATLAECERVRAERPGLVRVCSQPRGSYGEAIKSGILESRGSHVCILECDVLDQHFVERSIGLVQGFGAKFIVASKNHPDSDDRRSLQRRLLTRGFNTALRIVTRYPGTDTHGLKCVERALAERLCRIALTTDEVFQTEFVLLAWREGIDIYEVPIVLRETRPTPVSISRRLPKFVTTFRSLRGSLMRFDDATRDGAARRCGNVLNTPPSREQ